MTDQHSSPEPTAKELFARALELPASDRRAFVERECTGNNARRNEVLALLDQHARAGGFMASPTARPADHANPDSPINFPPLPSLPSTLLPALPSEQPGSKIGPYKLLQQIGEGGFGAVFMAEQTEPVRRRVALKLIRLGMDTKQFIARFEAERQALAVMDHPHIAKVFDAGATSEGRPYFVMELVAGEDITTYCERNKLSVRQRLDLFLQVCRAVQHAHTKGIIHRDLKPSNILVSTHEGEPCAKVIDFGIAKATSRPLTDKTFFTEHMAMLGTPAYCSPEQISGSPDIDTRSDVYALGVLLYELLSGTTPFDATELRAKAWDEVCRTIKEDEPPAPSVRLSSQNSLPLRGRVGERGPHEASTLARLIRGELDWITLKCLDKAPGRRYESASALAADIERHLSGEAVIAAPPSAAYRVRKFIRKNKATVAVGCALVAGVIGTGSGLFFAYRANADLRVANESLARQRDIARETMGEISQATSSAPMPPGEWRLQVGEGYFAGWKDGRENLQINDDEMRLLALKSFALRQIRVTVEQVTLTKEALAKADVANNRLQEQVEIAQRGFERVWKAAAPEWQLGLMTEMTHEVSVDGVTYGFTMSKGPDGTTVFRPAATEKMGDGTVPEADPAKRKSLGVLFVLTEIAANAVEALTKKEAELAQRNNELQEQLKQTRLAQADHFIALREWDTEGMGLGRRATRQDLEQAYRAREEYLGTHDPLTIEALYQYGVLAWREECLTGTDLMLEAIARKESVNPDPDRQLLAMWGETAGACSWHLRFEQAEELSKKLARCLPIAMQRERGGKDWINGAWTQEDWHRWVRVGTLGVSLLPVQPDPQTFRPIEVTSDRWRANVVDVLIGCVISAMSRWSQIWSLERDALHLDYDMHFYSDWSLYLVWAERALALDPSSPSAYQALSLSQFRLGAYTDALDANNRSAELRLATGSQLRSFDLALTAMIRWQLGEHDEARRTLERACEALSGLVSSGAIDDNNWEISDTRRLIEEAESLIEGRLVYPMQ